MSENKLRNLIINNGWSIGLALMAGYIVYKMLRRKRNLPPGKVFFSIRINLWLYEFDHRQCVRSTGHLR